MKLYQLPVIDNTTEYRSADKLLLFIGVLGYLAANMIRPILGGARLPQEMTLLLSGLVMPAFIGIGLLFIRKFHGKSFRKYADWRFDITENLISVVCVKAFALTFLAFAVTYLVMGSYTAFCVKHHIALDFSARQELAKVIQDILGRNRPLALCFLFETTVLTPLAEEILFRVTIPRFIYGFGIGAIPTMLLAAIVFGVSHSPAYIIPMMALFGLFQQFYQMKYGTHFSVVTHGLYNFTIFMILSW